MQIESIRCRHGVEVECPQRPELDCQYCAMDVFKEIEASDERSYA